MTGYTHNNMCTRYVHTSMHQVIVKDYVLRITTAVEAILGPKTCSKNIYVTNKAAR